MLEQTERQRESIMLNIIDGVLPLVGLHEGVCPVQRFPLTHVRVPFPVSLYPATQVYVTWVPGLYCVSLALVE